MSTLKVTNIQATGETASRAVSGVAAAWVTFKGTSTAAIEESSSVSSLTDNGTGDYTVTLTNSFSSANYGYVGMGGLNTTSLISVTQPRNLTSPTASAVRHQSVRIDATVVDARVVSTAYHGDLA